MVGLADYVVFATLAPVNSIHITSNLLLDGCWHRLGNSPDESSGLLGYHSIQTNSVK
jgi:hypothetical protein